MSNCPNTPHEFEDGVAVSVAIVGRDERGELVVTACNDPFLQMIGAALPDTQTFPVPFDSLSTDGKWQALRETLETCLRSDAAPQKQACEFHDVHDGACVGASRSNHLHILMAAQRRAKYSSRA